MFTVHVTKGLQKLGIVIEGGVNTKQPLPRIISIHPDGAAFRTRGLKIGQLLSQVDGYQLIGMYIVVVVFGPLLLIGLLSRNLGQNPTRPSCKILDRRFQGCPTRLWPG